MEIYLAKPQGYFDNENGNWEDNDWGNVWPGASQRK